MNESRLPPEGWWEFRSYEAVVHFVQNDLSRRHHASRSRPTLVAITGPDCSGKSSLSEVFRETYERQDYEVTTFSGDEYLIPRSHRSGLPTAAENYYTEGFNYQRLIADVRRTMASIGEDSPQAGGVPTCIILVEGLFLLRASLRNEWDYSIWLDIDDDEMMRRACHRDVGYFSSVDAVRSIYEEQIIPARRIHEERDDPIGFASLSVRLNSTP